MKNIYTIIEGLTIFWALFGGIILITSAFISVLLVLVVIYCLIKPLSGNSNL